MSELSLAAAQQADQVDPLCQFRDAFFMPDRLYFCGHSLGLQPKQTATYLEQELSHWAKLGVRGHFSGSRWYDYHTRVTEPLARLVGAHPTEVIAMNGLSVNLHLLLMSFFQPSDKRYKILIESNVFSSDRYVVISQLKQHGLDPETALIELPQDDNFCLSSETVQQTLQAQGHEVALVLLSGVNFLSGQVLDMRHITQLAHAAGCKIGFDLAHAVGNVPLQLHEWDVDFAAWCHYKYLNGGPGTIAGAYIHQRHVENPAVPRLAGWWGNDPSDRFRMTHQFEPVPTAESWQISNPPILQLAALRASLAIFEQTSMAALREKSVALTRYLLALIDQELSEVVSVLTPRIDSARGCQLSLRVANASDDLVDKISEAGIDVDFRQPNVIRLAPVPLYTQFVEVFECVQRLKSIL